MVRFKNRWLLVHVDFEKDAAGGSTSNAVGPVVLLRAIRDLIQQHFGDVGGGALGGSLAVRYYSPQTGNAIIRCARLGVQHVWAAMTMCTHLSGRRVRLLVTHCGGTIRKVQQAAIRQDIRLMARAQLQAREMRQRAEQATMSASQPAKAQPPSQSAANATGIAFDVDTEAMLAENRKAILAIQQ